jgi:hypothetical protein
MLSFINGQELFFTHYSFHVFYWQSNGRVEGFNNVYFIG